MKRPIKPQEQKWLLQLDRIIKKRDELEAFYGAQRDLTITYNKLKALRSYIATDRQPISMKKNYVPDQLTRLGNRVGYLKGRLAADKIKAEKLRTAQEQHAHYTSIEDRRKLYADRALF